MVDLNGSRSQLTQRAQISGLWIAAFFLIGLGCVQVYSSSFIFASEVRGDGLFFVKRQFLFAALAVVSLSAVSVLSQRWLHRLGLTLWAFACVGVALTLVPGLGVKAGGATRWLKVVGGQVIEPSEFLKVGLAFFFARVIVLKDKWIQAQPYSAEWSSRENAGGLSTELKFLFGFVLVVLAVVAGLLLKQPDFGTLVILTATLLGLLVVVGLPWSGLGVFAAMAAVTFYFLVVRVPYRWARIASFIDPWSVSGKEGFQAVQSMLSIRAGGLSGVGLGEGQGKLFFLPEAHTDFTLSVLGEELGFIGLTALLLLYGFCVYRGIRITLTARDQSDALVAMGLTLVFGLSVLINASVTMGLLPTKGLTLPFLSYGGSSSLAASVLVGTLLNIERRCVDA